ADQLNVDGRPDDVEDVVELEVIDIRAWGGHRSIDQARPATDGPVVGPVTENEDRLARVQGDARLPVDETGVRRQYHVEDADVRIHRPEDEPLLVHATVQAERDHRVCGGP